MNTHTIDCDYHCDQNPHECTCGFFDKARLTGQKPDGTYRRCLYPCQKTPGAWCSASVDPENQPAWTYTGPPDAPTLSPSVWCVSGDCWHGMITNGVVINPAKEPK